MATIPLTESAATAGHKISSFLRSLLLLLLDTFHRAIGTFSSEKRESPTLPTTPRLENQTEVGGMAAQDKASKPPSAPKIVPALPILPPQATKKENVPPPKDSEPKLDATVPQEKPEAPVIESMARLEIGSATPQIPAVKASIPVYGVTGDHAGFMREALDMVRPSRYFAFGFISPSCFYSCVSCFLSKPSARV